MATKLSTVFARQNNTTFEYRGEAVLAGSNLEVFSFQIKKRTDKKERDKEERPLGFGTLWGGPSTYVGAKGLIWIDKPTSVVRRIVFHYTDIDRDYPYVAIADSTNYTLVPIAGLGKFVLPVAGENLSCDRDGFCWRDVYGFSNCRKFAAQSRILPAQ